MGMPVVDDASVKLPWTSRKEVENGHRDDITLQIAFICSYLEGNLHHMFHLDSAGVAKPLDLVGVGVLHLDQLELGAKFFTCKVPTTPSIDDDLHGPSIDAHLCVEYMVSVSKPADLE